MSMDALHLREAGPEDIGGVLSLYDAAVNGCHKLALTSRASRSGAHAFHASLGFERHGIGFVVLPLAEAA